MSTNPVPRPADAHNIDHANALSMFTIALAIVAVFPGSLLGALLVWSVWRITRPDSLTKWLVAGLGVATVIILNSTVAVGWPWRLALQALFDPSGSSGLTPDVIGWSVLTEALLGPLALATQELGRLYWHRTIQGQD